MFSSLLPTQKCRFGYPKPLQPKTAFVTEDNDPVLLTARNDSLINSFNPVQRRANVDMQYCVSRHKVIEYCAKYATKSEPRSQPLKEIFATIVRSLKENNSSLKAMQKLLINSVDERDFSTQETCHLLFQLPMFKASRNFVVLSLEDLVLLMSTWMKTNQLQCCQLWTTTSLDLPLPSFRICHCSILSISTPCPRRPALSHPREESGCPRQAILLTRSTRP